jgi:hypothetical protein
VIVKSKAVFASAPAASLVPTAPVKMSTSPVEVPATTVSVSASRALAFKSTAAVPVIVRVVAAPKS